MSRTPERWTVRQLPLPAKLVLSVFLISVGLGYLSAMMQLHFKHATSGNPLPTVQDMVARFSGRAWPLQEKRADNGNAAAVANPAANAPREVARMAIRSIFINRCVACHSPEGAEEPPFGKYPDESKDRVADWEAFAKFLGPSPDKGKIHKLLTADPEAAWGKDSSMRKAFSTKHPDWKEDLKVRVKKLGGDDAKALKELSDERDKERLAIVYWLEKGAPKSAFDDDALEVVFPPKADDRLVQVAAPEDPERKAKRRQMSVDSLTQSTHAHLLSFAMLWAITGFTFAFTSYPVWFRVLLAPSVLLAQVVDVACWWLARLDGVGPYFAIAIVGTGAVVGLGLSAQIVLSLFNMYGCKGKALLVALFLAGAGGFGLLYVNHIEPQFAAERQEARAAQP